MLLGFSYSGKTSAGNTILGNDEFDLSQVTQSCVMKTKRVCHMKVTVVDTPSWTANEDFSTWAAQVINACPRLHAFLVVIPIFRSFDTIMASTIYNHMNCLSERVWSHTMVLFTYGDWLEDQTIEQFIESEGKSLQWLIRKCENRYHVVNNRNTGDRSQVTDLFRKIEEIVTINSGHLEFDQDWSAWAKETHCNLDAQQISEQLEQMDLAADSKNLPPKCKTLNYK